MGLLTVDELREHVETALSDTALERILASCEAVIADWAGPLGFDDEGSVLDVTETRSAPGRRLLTLRQRPTAVASVIDTTGTTNIDVDPSDCRTEVYLGIPYLRRLGERTWGERTTVVHTPTDDSAVRRTGLVLLCQLELNYQPGMAAQGAGPWSETYGKYLRTRSEILRGIRPADPMVPRAVPYTPAWDQGGRGRR